MSDVFIFDVDGTLTNSRSPIDPEFSIYMEKFCERFDCYLVTGSDREKTIEQLGDSLYNKFRKAYQCQGNDVWSGDTHINTNPIEPTEKMSDIFDTFLKESQFPLRTKNHVEKRPGLINFSIVGRNATLGERMLYEEWDKNTGERELIAQMINESCPGYIATPAGVTGIDIVKEGCDKRQILKDFGYWDNITFFGDAVHENGNDMALAIELLNGKYTNGFVHSVMDWTETWFHLRTHMES